MLRLLPFPTLNWNPRTRSRQEKISFSSPRLWHGFLVTSLTVIESRELGPSDSGSEAWISFLGAQMKLTVWPGAGLCAVPSLWSPWGIFFFFFKWKSPARYIQNMLNKAVFQNASWLMSSCFFFFFNPQKAPILLKGL